MPATRLQLLDRAAIRADMDSSGFPTAAQRITTLNEQVRSLWAWMVNANYPAKRTTVSIDATSGGGPYPLTGVADLLRVVAVRDNRFPSTSVQGWVRRANDLERSVVSEGPSLPMFRTVAEVKYDIEVDAVTGPELRLVPPTTIGNFKVECITGHPGLTSDISVWYGPDPSDEVLVLLTAAAWREKEDPAGARHLRAEAADRKSELWQVVQALAAPLRVMDFITAEEEMCSDHHLGL